MYKRIVTAALVFGTLALAPPAGAQMPCFERDRLAAYLAERYGESRAGVGVQDSRSLIEIWTSRDSGTWTLTLTRPDGTACVIASGVAWQDGAGAPMPVGDGV